jgi:uncharacterized membrane protein YoaK (UPF0700 family)
MYRLLSLHRTDPKAPANSPSSQGTEADSGLIKLLLAVTVMTGLIDAISVLSLGRVFVANVTGTIVFIGFALAGTPGFPLTASLCAFAGFLMGSIVAGRAGRRSPDNRYRMLRNSAATAVGLFVVALGITIADSGQASGRNADVVLFVMALAMGAQNATVRRMAVDLRTNMLTTTVTEIGAYLRDRKLRSAGRQVLSVLCLLGGGVVGAVLSHSVSVVAMLSVVIAGFAIVAVIAGRLTTSQPSAAVGQSPSPADNRQRPSGVQSGGEAVDRCVKR